MPQFLKDKGVNSIIAGGMGMRAQELFREANTINSKAQDIAIIKDSLIIKSELECIRQQVQNLE